MLPRPIAAPPWIPKRKRQTFELEIEPDEKAMGEAFPPHFRMGWGKDEYLEIPQNRRQAVLMERYRQGKIMKIHLADHLGVDALMEILDHGKPEFITHYGIVETLLSLQGWEAWDALIEYNERAPHRVFPILQSIDCSRVGYLLAELCFHHDRAAAEEHEKRFEYYARAHPIAAMHALIPLVVVADKKLHNKALKLLLEMEYLGLSEAIVEACEHYGEAVAVEVRALMARTPLPARAPKMPAWWAPEQLPTPKLVDGEPIEGQALVLLSNLMALLPLEAAEEAISEVMEVAEPKSMEVFVHAMMQAWVESGGKTKDKWVIFAVGIAGGPDEARRLADLAREWADDGKHARSALAMEAMVQTGSDIALLRLSELTRGKKSALKKRALSVLEDYSESQGWSPDELSDRLVPDLGLDEQGGCNLDFGPRHLRLELL